MNTTIWSALTEPNRLRIVEILREGPLTVGEIADRLHMRQPSASKHLRVLLEAGIVDCNAESNRRIYKLRAEPFKELNSWLKQYLEMWEEQLDNLDLYLQQLQKKD